VKITIIQVGKTRAPYLQEAENEYLKRLGAYAKIKTITLKEAHPDGKNTDIAKEREGTEILKNLPKDSFIVALDERGRQFTSVEFAELLQKRRDFEGGDVTFVTGGCYGLAASVLVRTHLKLAFGKFTFTHELIRTLLLEQVYRAFTIIAGKTYHF
jgi:23S rRNA (pseudouridine1915-N3)-methyltransferase